MTKNKRLARLQRFTKKHNLVLSVLILVLSLILPLIIGQESVIIKIVTVHQVNLDVTDAYAHPSAILNVGASFTVTAQNASGILHY